MYQAASGIYRIPKGFRNILPAKTAVSGETEFRHNFNRESETKLTEFHQDILCYRGELPQPQWLDVDPDMYKRVCDITVDLSRMEQPPLPKVDGTKGKFYRVSYDVILLFGSTELQAQVAWKEDDVEKRTPAKIIYWPS